MTFGGAPNPSQWSDVSEVIADLANDLVRRSNWDPSVWSAPRQGILRTSEAIENDKGHVQPDKEFVRAFAMSVADPVGDGLAKFDCYLDDLLGVFRDWDRGRRRRQYRSRCISLGGQWTIRHQNPFLETVFWLFQSSLPRQRLRRGRPFSVGR
jgi:hypothetical protein